MTKALRIFKAKDFEHTHFDNLVHFTHDVFYTPVSSAIGNSFVSFVAAVFMLLVASDASATIGYMNALVS